MPSAARPARTALSLPAPPLGSPRFGSRDPQRPTSPSTRARPAASVRLTSTQRAGLRSARATLKVFFNQRRPRLRGLTPPAAPARPCLPRAPRLRRGVTPGSRAAELRAERSSCGVPTPPTVWLRARACAAGPIAQVAAAGVDARQGNPAGSHLCRSKRAGSRENARSCCCLARGRGEGGRRRRATPEDGCRGRACQTQAVSSSGGCHAGLYGKSPD